MSGVSTSGLTSGAVIVLIAGSVANAQSWVQFNNQTASRMVAEPAISLTDPEEKDYAWGDVDHDGDVDLIVARKTPFTNPGGKRNILFQNEGVAEGHAINGVLVDRSLEYGSASVNVPASEGISQGLLDLTNDRDVKLADVNNDGWLDVITAPAVSEGLPRFIGHPRVYLNLGEAKGQWQGFVYDYGRIPQLLSKTGIACNPRFSEVAAGDLNNDGFIDLFFTDYDSGELGPDELPAEDMDNKLLLNAGPKDPGTFIDATNPSLAAMFNYGGTVGTQNLALSSFGLGAVIADMTGDGLNDLVRITTLTPPQHVSVIKNNASAPGVFAGTDYKVSYALSPYFVSVDDLNNDGKLDMVVTDDNADRYALNTGNDASGNPTFQLITFSYASGSDDGFGDESVIADLDNDGWKDALVCDVQVDGFGCARRLHIYHNLGNPPNVTLKEESPLVLSPNMTGTHDVAVFDLNSDGWKDLVVGRCTSTWIWMNVPPCPADNSPLGGNGTVDVDDLLNIINNWGGNIGPADITQNGAIDVDDLLAVINAWGSCE